MLKFLKSRLFIVLLGFALLALFIWYAGPYFGFGFGSSLIQPLASPFARLFLIGVILAAGLFWSALSKDARQQYVKCVYR